MEKNLGVTKQIDLDNQRSVKLSATSLHATVTGISEKFDENWNLRLLPDIMQLKESC